MNELTCFNWKYLKKTQKLSRNDKFVINKTKICSFFDGFGCIHKYQLISKVN